MIKCYRYQFNTFISFSSPVYQHSFKLRCVPVNNEVQHILGHEIEIEPFVHMDRGVDAFGNTIITGEIVAEHREFIIRSNGLAEQHFYRFKEECHPLYYCASSLTIPDKKLQDYNKEISTLLTGNHWEQAVILANMVNNYLTYTPGVTQTTTTASEVFELQQGVCQDYAHLLIALCRMNGIGARYVCGFMQGEGVTHAWVEVYCNGYWLALDPTHNRKIEYGYIKLAQGRDAAD